MMYDWRSDKVGNFANDDGLRDRLWYLEANGWEVFSVVFVSRWFIEDEWRIVSRKVAPAEPERES